MPRAHRNYLPRYVWHLTHRCHRRRFLLKLAPDRRLWRSRLYQARKRYGPCVLDYIVTSNHIHLLVRDQGRDEIAASMQLIEGRTAQLFNARKSHAGAYWEDHYHATAVETGEHPVRCLVSIDLNMVRAGVLEHPAQWQVGGYQEIQRPPARYRIVDRRALAQRSGSSWPRSPARTASGWKRRCDVDNGGARPCGASVQRLAGASSSSVCRVSSTTAGAIAGSRRSTTYSSSVTRPLPTGSHFDAETGVTTSN